MRIALVQCPLWSKDCPSYSLALLGAGLKNGGHTVKGFDLNYHLYNSLTDNEMTATWDLDYKSRVWNNLDYVRDAFKRFKQEIGDFIEEILKFKPEIIGISVFTSSFLATQAFTRLLKKKKGNLKILLGGPECFPRFRGADILHAIDADAVCLGEADLLLPGFVRQWQAQGFCTRGSEWGGLKPEPPKDLDGLPFADYSIFHEKPQNRLSIATSRGCFNQCNFCSEWGNYRFRSADNIFKEIQHQKKQFPRVNLFWFNDSLINGNILELDNLCDLLIKSKPGILWGGQAVPRREMKLPLLKKMRAAGCKYICYGVESGSQEVLKHMNKRYDVQDIKRVIRQSHEAGMEVVYNLIAGHPAEEQGHVKETKRFIRETRKFATEIYLSPCAIMKGSQLYEKRQEIGIVIPAKGEWYLKNGSNTPEIRKQRILEYLSEVKGSKSALQVRV